MAAKMLGPQKVLSTPVAEITLPIFLIRVRHVDVGLELLEPGESHATDVAHVAPDLEVDLVHVPLQLAGVRKRFPTGLLGKMRNRKL